MLVIRCNITSSGVLVRVYFFILFAARFSLWLKHRSDTFCLRCSAASCCRSSSWRVVVLHILSASRSLTGIITQLPLFTLSLVNLLFADRPYSIRALFGNYLVLFCADHALPSFIQTTTFNLPVARSTHTPLGSSVHCIIQATTRFYTLLDTFLPMPPTLHVHAFTPPTPTSGATHARFNH